jgi:uncharacterized protein YwlG (UPF0340 family)
MPELLNHCRAFLQKQLNVNGRVGGDVAVESFVAVANHDHGLVIIGLHVAVVTLPVKT